jgi:hypothetical protein
MSLLFSGKDHACIAGKLSPHNSAIANCFAIWGDAHFAVTARGSGDSIFMS